MCDLALARVTGNIFPFLLLIGIAGSLITVGEFTGEFGQIRRLASTPQNVLNMSRGEFVFLNNGVLFGFDVDSAGASVLRVKLSTNQTYGWLDSIEKGKRILRSENFTLDAKTCSFEIDVSVEFYDRQTLLIVDNTQPEP